MSDELRAAYRRQEDLESQLNTLTQMWNVCDADRSALRARVAEQADKIVRYEAELARVYLIADQYRIGRCCTYCNRIINGLPAETAGLAGNKTEVLK